MNPDDSITLSDNSSDDDSFVDLPKKLKSESKEIDNANLQDNENKVSDFANIERMNTYYQPTDIKKLIKRIKEAIKGNKTKEISLKKSLVFEDFDYLKSIIVKKQSIIDYEKLYKNIYEIRENYEEEKPILGKKKKIIKLRIIRKPQPQKDVNTNTNPADNNANNANANKENSNKENKKSEDDKKKDTNNADMENDIKDILIINDEAVEENHNENKKNNDDKEKTKNKEDIKKLKENYLNKNNNNEKIEKNNNENEDVDFKKLFENKNLENIENKGSKEKEDELKQNINETTLDDFKKNNNNTIDKYFKDKRIDFRKSMGVKKKKEENKEVQEKTNDNIKNEEKKNPEEYEDKSTQKNNVKENDNDKKASNINAITPQKEPEKIGKKVVNSKSSKNITAFADSNEEVKVKKSEKMLSRIAMFESKNNKEKDNYKSKKPYIGASSNKNVCFAQFGNESINPNKKNPIKNTKNMSNKNLCKNFKDLFSDEKEDKKK